MSTQCTNKRVATSKVILSDPRITKVIEDISAKIVELEKKASVLDKDAAEYINRQIDMAKIDLESVTIATLLKEDFSVVQRQNLVKQLKKRGGSIEDAINFLEGLDGYALRASDDSLNAILKSQGVGGRAIKSQDATMLQIREAAIRKIAMEKAVEGRYGSSDTMMELLGFTKTAINKIGNNLLERLTDKEFTELEDSVKKEKLYKSISQILAEPTTEAGQRKLINNYIVGKIFLSDDPVTKVGLEKFIKGSPKNTISVDDVQATSTLTDLENIVFAYTEELKNPAIRDAVQTKYTKIKTGLEGQQLLTFEILNKYKTIINDSEAYRDAISGEWVFQRAKLLGLNIAGVSGRQMRKDVLDFLQGRTSQISWNQLSEDGKAIQKLVIDDNNKYIAIQLLGYDEIERLGFDATAIRNMYESAFDDAAVDNAIKKGANSVEEAKKAMAELKTWVNEHSPKPSSKELSDRIFSYVSGKTASLDSAVYYDSTADMAKALGEDGGLFDTYKALYERNSAKISDKAMDVADSFKKLEKKMLSASEAGLAPKAIILKDSRLLSDPKLAKLKDDYYKKYGTNPVFIAPSGRLELNFILGPDNKLYVGASSEPRLKELTDVFGSVGYADTAAIDDNVFGVTQSQIDDSFNNYMIAKYGKNDAESYTKELRKMYGAMAPIEAYTRVKTLANESSFFIEYADLKGQWELISKMPQSELESKISSIAAFFGLPPLDGKQQKRGANKLQQIRQDYFNFQFTPLDVGKRRSDAIRLKNESAYRLFGNSGYTGSIPNYYTTSQFNLSINEDGFKSPFDGAREYIDNAYAGTLNDNDNYLNAFIKANQNTPQFQRLPGAKARDKASAYLQGVFERSARDIAGIPQKEIPFNAPTGKGLALVDVSSELDGLREEISEYFVKNKKFFAPNLTEIKRIHTEILDEYKAEMTAAVNRNAPQTELDAIKSKYFVAVTEFEQGLLLRELGGFYSTQDRKAKLVGNKYKLMGIQNKSQLPLLDESVDNAKQAIDNVIVDVEARMKSVAAGKSLNDFGLIVAPGDKADVAIGIEDYIMKKIGMLTDDMGTVSMFKNMEREALDTLSLAQKTELLNYLEAAINIKGKVDGVLQAFYRNVGPRIKAEDFFRRYKLVPTVFGDMPQAIVEADTISDLLGVLDFTAHDLYSKKQIFDGIRNAMGSAEWSTDVLDNDIIIKSVISDVLNKVIAEKGIKMTPETLARLNQQYALAFSVYGDLVPISDSSIAKVQSMMGEVAPDFADLLISTNKSNFSSISTTPSIGLGEYLGDTDIPRITESMMLPQSEVDRVNTMFEETIDDVASGLNQVGDSLEGVSNSLLNRARPLLEKWARTNAFVTMHDALQGGGYTTRAIGALNLIDKVVRNITQYGVELNAIKRAESLYDIELLKQSQQAFVDGGYMNMSEEIFSQINPTELDEANKIAYFVSDWFRTVRDQLNLSDTGATGVSRSSAINRDLFAMSESFLNIGKNADDNVVAQFNAFKNAIRESSVLKIALESGAQSDFFSKYRKIIKSDSLGRDFHDNTLSKDFTEEFNQAFGTAYTENDVATISTYLFGLRLNNFLEGELSTALQDAFKFLALPIGRSVVRFGFNVLSSVAQAPSWILRNESIGKGINPEELNKLSGIADEYGILSDLADVSDLARLGKDRVYGLLDKLGINSADDAMTRQKKILTGVNRALGKEGTFDNTVSWILSQGNNFQEFLASAYTKDVAFYRAMQENTFRSFATVDEFEQFLRDDNISATYKKQVMDNISAVTNKVYSDVMGMGFGAIDNVVAVTPQQKLAKLIYESQSYMAGWGANVMGTLFDNVARLYGIGGYIRRNGYSAQAVQQAANYLTNSRQFVDLMNTLYGDIRNTMKLVRFNRTGESDNGDTSLQDILDTLGTVSVYMQAANVLFKPVFAAIDSATDAANKGEDVRADRFGLGAFTRSFIGNIGRQMKSVEFTTDIIKGYAEGGADGAYRALEQSLLNMGAGSLNYIMGNSDFTSERYQFGSLPAALAQKNTQNPDLSAMFTQKDDWIWNLMKQGDVGGALGAAFDGNKAWQFTRDAAGLGWEFLKMLAGEENKDIVGSEVENYAAVIGAAESSRPRQLYMANGVAPIENKMDADSIVKQFRTIDGIGTTDFVKGIDYYLSMGSYVYDGRSSYVDNVYDSMLKSIPKDVLLNIRNTVNNEPSSAKRKQYSIYLMDNAVDTYLRDDPRYVEMKSMTESAKLLYGYDGADDGSKLSPEQKAQRQVAFLIANNQTLAQLNRAAYTEFVVDKIARDGSKDPNMQKFMTFISDKNKYALAPGIASGLEKIDRFRDRLDAGDVAGAIAVYGPLNRGNWDEKSATEQVAYMDQITNTINYIYQSSQIPEKLKTQMAADYLIANPLTPEQFDVMVTKGGDRFNDAYKAFAATMYNTEGKIVDLFRDVSGTGGAGAKMKKFKSVKYDVSKLLDGMRDFAINANDELSKVRGLSSSERLSPAVMELIKLSAPSKFDAPLQKLDLTPLPAPGKDIQRKVKVRKKPVFKTKKK